MPKPLSHARWFLSGLPPTLKFVVAAAAAAVAVKIRRACVATGAPTELAAR